MAILIWDKKSKKALGSAYKNTILEHYPRAVHQELIAVSEDFAFGGINFLLKAKNDRTRSLFTVVVFPHGIGTQTRAILPLDTMWQIPNEFAEIIKDESL